MKFMCCFLLFTLFNIFTSEATGNLGYKTVKVREGRYVNFLDVSSVNSFTANLKGESAGVIGLFDDERIVYYILIRADQFAIREYILSATCLETTRYINTTFNNDTFSPFWFQWEVGQVEFGTGIVAGVNRIGLHQDNRTVNVNYWAASCGQGLHYVNYQHTSKFSCHNGYKLVHATAVPRQKTALSLVDCSRECGKKPFCFAVNYRRQQFDNCEQYIMSSKDENDDVIVPFHITPNTEWLYCQMTNQ